MDGERATLGAETLLRGLEEVRARLQARQKQLEGLKREQESDQEEEKLLASLYALRTGQPATNGDASYRRRRSIPHPVVEAVVAALEEAGRPLHISELMVILRERNVTIPGSGQQANVIAHITRDKRIVRPLRGMYALAAWPSESIPTGPARRHRVRSTNRTRVGTQGGS